ncbi:MAG TPA: potassium-transporting ATPase subunit KdpC [Gemmatimonadales bacterium]|nr:potassium-transporting ATPase subunit KdpC [Gemmatimonadales bacterium]
MFDRLLRPAIAMTLALCVITGLVYPGVVTGAAQLLFPSQANGSIVEVNGRPVGSALIGQPFTRPEYFHPRPSAAGSGYDAAASAASNKGPTDRKLADTLIAEAVERAVQEDGANRGRIPTDMATASASGLDPHISPANAELQVARVARARGLSPKRVRELVDRHTEGRQFGILGEPRVNVLLLNIALDSLD